MSLSIDCDLFCVWPSPFCDKLIFLLSWKEVASSNKNGICRRLEYLQIFLGLRITYYRDICSDKLDLKRKNEDSNKVMFSYLSIEAYNKNLPQSCLFGKGDVFSFDIDLIPLLITSINNRGIELSCVVLMQIVLKFT